MDITQNVTRILLQFQSLKINYNHHQWYGILNPETHQASILKQVSSVANVYFVGKQEVHHARERTHRKSTQNFIQSNHCGTLGVRIQPPQKHTHVDGMQQWKPCYTKTRISVCETYFIRLTRTDIVWKTMLKSKQFSDECRSQYTSVIYDLKIAKVAKQIQSEERPTLILFFCHVWRVSYRAKPIFSKS